MLFPEEYPSEKLVEVYKLFDKYSIPQSDRDIFVNNIIGFSLFLLERKEDAGITTLKRFYEKYAILERE